MDVPATLRIARRHAGMSQSDLALRAGTSQATISAYESGRKVPSVETLTRLLAATGSHLAVEPGVAHLPTRAERELRARALGDVLALAEALPARRRGRLRYPRLAA